MDFPAIDLPPGSVAVVLGTRPEIVKLAHIISGLGDRVQVIHTGQHYDYALSAAFFDAFGIPEPSAFLGVGGKTRAGQIASALGALDERFASEAPKVVVVQGDTNTTLAGALAANAYEIPLVHVEAGLRSRDRRMPEEHNRVLTDAVADLLCAPTDVAVGNLVGEGVPETLIELTGNTVIEAVGGLMPEPGKRSALLDEYGLESGKFVLSTIHRPENVDDPDRYETILEQLAALDLPVVLPLHPRSKKRAESFGLGDLLSRLRVIEPLGYVEFLALSAESGFLVSDSGGVQEEVSVYKRPVIVVRRSTERPEVLGTFARLVEPDAITETAASWLSDLEGVHAQLATLESPYGDGSASARIVEAIGRRFAGA
ncbi:MAG: UDP-N-acetylglucosamine 2-epimerase (non-hydrolyzing) [Acidimicrobiales bacterium]|jgi:UDP-N-acetylglucosamine 2-epimerase (non-hydrolysing)|nr:UDP-N-acetylglucosamine 2-epimerase (non-hydrolyzing) [Acidimicrobiales bacterium]